MTDKITLHTMLGNYPNTKAIKSGEVPLRRWSTSISSK